MTAPPMLLPVRARSITPSWDDWGKHERAGWICQRAHDIERCAGAVGLLQGSVAHVELQPEQHAMVDSLRGRNTQEIQAVILGLRALIFREYGKRRGWQPPLRLRLPRPGLEAPGWIAGQEVDVAIRIHHRALDQEIWINEVTAGPANEPSVDTVDVGEADITDI